MEKLCNVIDALLTAPTQRLWMIVPYIHTDKEDSWVNHFLKEFCQKAKAGCDLRVVLRPESCNQLTIQQLTAANIEVISPKNLPLYQKIIVSDNAVVRMETNLTDKELKTSAGCSISTSPEDIESAFQWIEGFESALSEIPSRTERGLLPIKEVVKEEFLPWIEGIDLVSSRQASIIQQILHPTDGLLIIDSSLADRATLMTIAAAKELMEQRKILHISPDFPPYDFYRKFEPKGCKIHRIVGEEKFDFLKALNPNILLSSGHNFWKLLCSQSPELPTIDSFLKEINLVIIDEIERLAEPERGQELERVLLQLENLPNARPVRNGISNGARRVVFGNNVANAKEIASWLKAKLNKLGSSEVPLFTEVVPYETSEQWYKTQIKKNEKLQPILQEMLSLRKKIIIVVDNKKTGFQLGWQLYRSISVLEEPREVLLASTSPSIQELLKNGIGIWSQDSDDAGQARIIRVFNKGELPILIVTSSRRNIRIDCDCIIIRDLPENPLKLFDLLKLASGYAYILSPVERVEEIQRNLQEGIVINSPLSKYLPRWLNTEIYFKQRVTKGELASRIDETLLGWQKRNFRESLQRGLKKLLEDRFIQIKGQELTSTEFGVLTAQEDQSLATAVFLAQFCRKAKIENKSAQEIETLTLKNCVCSPEYEDIVPQLGELEELLFLRRSNGTYCELSLSQVKILATLNKRLFPSEAGTTTTLSVNDEIVRRAVRLLSYLSKLAFIRENPIIGIIANDLAMRIEFGIAYRGCGAILRLLRDAFVCMADKKQILDRYKILQEMNVSRPEQLSQSIQELSRRIKNFRYLNDVIRRLPRFAVEIPSPQIAGRGLRGIIKTTIPKLHYVCFIKRNGRVFTSKFSSPENGRSDFSLDLLPAPNREPISGSGPASNPVTIGQGKKKIAVEAIGWNQYGWSWFSKLMEIEVKSPEELEKSLSQLLAQIQKRKTPEVAEKSKRLLLGKKGRYKKGRKEFYLNFCDFDSELLKSLVENLLNFVEDEHQKIGTICEFVLSRVKIIEQLGTVPQHAIQTLARREGNQDDIALVVLGLIKAAGFGCDLTGGVFQDGRVCFLPAVELAGEWYQVDLFKNAASAIEVFDFGAGRKYRQDNFSLEEFFSRSSTPSGIHPWLEEYLKPAMNRSGSGPAVKEIREEFQPLDIEVSISPSYKLDKEIRQVKTLCHQIQLYETEIEKMKISLGQVREKLQSQKKDLEKWRETIKLEKAQETAETGQWESQELQKIKFSEETIQREEERINQINNQIKDLINFVNCGCCGEENPRQAHFCRNCGSCLEG